MSHTYHDLRIRAAEFLHSRDFSLTHLDILSHMFHLAFSTHFEGPFLHIDAKHLGVRIRSQKLVLYVKESSTYYESYLVDLSILVSKD